MTIRPYRKTDGDMVLRLFDNFVDYAPNDEVDQDFLDDQKEFFEDLYIKESAGGVEYIGLSDEGNVIAFIHASKRDVDGGRKQCWYIEPLFVSTLVDTKATAQMMVKHLEKELVDADTELCATVYPTSTEAINFWEAIGYVEKPKRAIFFSTKDVKLLAFALPQN